MWWTSNLHSTANNRKVLADEQQIEAKKEKWKTESHNKYLAKEDWIWNAEKCAVNTYKKHSHAPTTNIMHAWSISLVIELESADNETPKTHRGDIYNVGLISAAVLKPNLVAFKMPLHSSASLAHHTIP